MPASRARRIGHAVVIGIEKYRAKLPNAEYAAGNRAKLIRYNRNTGKQAEYNIKLSSLLKNGDSSANVRLEPGDVIIIPESMF